MSRSRRVAAATVTALIVASGLTACGGGSDDANVTYAPAAYGVSGQCFYDQDPAEAVALIAAGLCPSGWVPAPMPLYWHEEYYGYYSSPSYYNVYVPATRRTVYVTHETTFHATYSTQITSASSKATYKGSNGKTVTGPKTGAVKFGGGSGRVQQYGGGSGRSGAIGGSTGGTSGGSKSGAAGTSKSKAVTSFGGGAGRK